MDARATVRINGEPRRVRGGSIADLLGELGFDPDRQGIAVALNDEVVSRSRWSACEIRDGDRVEIIGAVQGG